jgi:hypothetical protein
MKKFMRIGVIFLCAAVVLTIVGFVPAVFVQAASADTAIPKIHLAASAKQVQAGDTFEVGIWLQNFNENYSGIEGFQVRLKYDPAFIIPVDLIRKRSSAKQSNPIHTRIQLDSRERLNSLSPCLRKV